MTNEFCLGGDVPINRLGSVQTLHVASAMTRRLDTCAKSGIAFVPFGPMGSGHSDLNDDRIAKVAARHDATVSQIALAWLLTLSPVTLAIPGTGSVAHLEENVRAGSISLTANDLAELALTASSRENTHA